MTESNQIGTPIESAIQLVGRPEQSRGQTVHASVELGIVDSLDEEPKTPGEIASDLDHPRDYSRRLLRALDAYGVLDEDDGRYVPTPVGERLRSDHPETVRDYLLFFYHPTRFAAIRHLPEIVAQGDPTGYDLEFGQSTFEIFDEDPEFSEQFNGKQDPSSLGETEQILDTLEAVDFSQFSTICDVGGGYGALLSHLLERHEHLEGKLLELPSVVAEKERLWAPRNSAWRTVVTTSRAICSRRCREQTLTASGRSCMTGPTRTVSGSSRTFTRPLRRRVACS